MKYKKLVGLSLAILISACNSEDKKQQETSSPESLGVEKIGLTGLDGKPIALEQYKGKTIFLNFWATWCKPCMEEMPSIERVQNMLQNEAVIFLLASPEAVEEIDAFRNNRGYKFNYARVENMEELGIQSLPTTFIFNPKGKLVFSETGYRKWDEKENIDIIHKTENKND